MIRYIIILIITMIFSCMKLSDPFIPVDQTGGYTVKKTLRTTGWALDIAIFDTNAYIAQGEAGIAVLSINDIDNPVLLSEVGTDIGGNDKLRGYISKVSVKQGVLYASAGSFGLSVIDARDPAFPVVTGSNINPKPAKDALVFRKLLFTAVSERGFVVSNISNPVNPDSRGETRTPGFSNALDVSSDSTFLLVACGEAGLALYPTTAFVDGEEPCTLKSFIDLPGHAKDVCTNKSLAFVACKMDGLCIVDFSNPSSLKLVSSYKAQSSIENVCCKDTIVYLIDGKNFVALSVANPANPCIIGKIKMTYPAGIKTYKDYILVADRRDGLVIIQHSGERM